MGLHLSTGRQALAGGAMWVTWALTVHPSWTAQILLLSPLVLVPLGLGLADRPDAGPSTALLGLVRVLALPAAVLAALSFTVDAGVTAGALTAPWLIVGICAGAIGVGRLLSRSSVAPTIGTDLSLVFLAVGAAWLTTSRGGLRPLGFSDTIVQLTAVHFHYAGFALPLVAGLAAQRARATAFVPLLAAAGVPFTAIGITAGGTLEWLAATTMAIAGLATAVLLVRAALRPRSHSAGLLVLAAMALTAGMCLGLDWAWAVHFGWRHLDIEAMARWHGSLNALGFGFVALTALHLSPPAADARRTSAAVRLRWRSASTLRAIAADANQHDATRPMAFDHRALRHETWATELPHGFDAGRDALRSWAGHRAAGMILPEPAPSLERGNTIAFAIPLGPLAVTAACRIIDVIDEPDRFGFTYATLPHHPEFGDESFTIERATDGTATYTIAARWRPSILLARLAPPLTRVVQRRAIGHYLTGVAEWTTEPPPPGAHR